MALAVADAMKTGEHLLVQAGTGTGKSLAYLVPALLSDTPVVVSTATLALQAQLVNGDLPRLAAAVEPVLGKKPVYALVKGRHHYLCLAKLDSSTVDEPDLFSAGADDGPKWLGQAGKLGQQVQRIRDWAQTTTEGDRDELDPGVDDTAWRAVSMPARECIGAQKCQFGPECFAEQSRERARAADIVVTNHSLLAFDSMAGRHILPDHDVLIIDEAHELAERVTSATQAELTTSALDTAARRARQHIEAGAYERLVEASDSLAVALGDARPGRIEQLHGQLREALTIVDSACRFAIEAIGDIKNDDPSAVDKQPAKVNLTQITETAQRLLEEAAHDVAWVEKDDRGNRRAVLVAPLSVAGTLTETLYPERVVIASSATLALGGEFKAVARSLGLPLDEKPEAGLRWTSLDVGSPFDYPKQGILYVASHLPRPQMSGLPDAAAEELVELVQALGGRSLGLFSSRKAAERAAEVVRERTDLTVLLQGEESLPLLVKRFKAEPDTCLFGVMSLWQGVDVPGDACQLVVIDRLPFPRPDEPLLAARSAAVDAAGGSGFASVSVPHAAVRLAQGAGRLIRTLGDKGMVAVLDSRLHTQRSYGPFLRKSLPPFWYTTDPGVARSALKRLKESNEK
ncbi:ATP-dependent DNA helicase [Longispora albida]|uniref:ATP-dependent DNA helicase n=1 Tax=Longispora albida TaxID=203523 RepID=UPI000A0008C4|nr:ATP-dependent DNA helicase [Longispora albida]